MMLPKPPEWLTKRDGSLTPGLNESLVFVLISGAPQYKLESRPGSAEKFICAIQQTVNGRRLDDGTTYPSPEAALLGGLDQLRVKLGW